MASHDTAAETALDDSSLRANIESDIQGLLDRDKTAFIRFVDLNMSLFTKVSELETSHKMALDALQTSEGRIGLLTREVEALKFENGFLVSQLAMVDDSTRSNNLRVEGLLEANNENIKETIAACLSRSGIICRADDIDYARRLGRYREGQTRPVLVRLLKEGQRNAILYNRFNVTRNSNPPVWVNDDVSEITRKQRKRVRDVAYLAKLKGINNVKIHSDGVIIGNEKFHHSDLDLLPLNLSIENATTRINDEDIFFQGAESPFSNFYPSTIVDENDRIFFNAEQLFHHRRATYHGKTNIANKILKTRSPTEIKKLSKKFQSSPDWRASEESIMAEILLLKFTQNRDLGQTLLKTGERQLHEATGDRKWAVGFDISSKGLTDKEWPGGDLLGQLLENTREAIKGSAGPVSPLRSNTTDLDLLTSSEDFSMIPIPVDECHEEENEDEDDGGDEVYEECVQMEDNLEVSPPSPSSKADLSSPSSLPAQPTTTQSKSTTGLGLTESPSIQTLSSDVEPSPELSKKKRRNPFRPSAQTKVKSLPATSEVFDQQFNISGRRQRATSQQLSSTDGISAGKARTRSTNRSRAK